MVSYGQTEWLLSLCDRSNFSVKILQAVAMSDSMVDGKLILIILGIVFLQV